MSTFIDIAMSILFVLFMIFIFGGYHKNKSAQREAQREADEQKEKDTKDTVLK
jgi:hypothetical protein